MPDKCPECGLAVEIIGGDMKSHAHGVGKGWALSPEAIAVACYGEQIAQLRRQLAQAKAVIAKLLAGQGVAFCVVGHGEHERVVEGRLNIVSLFEPPDTKPDGLWVMDLADCHLTREAAAAAKNKDAPDGK